MTPNNYKNIDRFHGLNLNELTLCLKGIAHWHAASAKLLEEVFLKHFFFACFCVFKKTKILSLGIIEFLQSIFETSYQFDWFKTLSNTF